MNKDLVQHLTKYYQIGDHLNSPVRVNGAEIHAMWRLETTTGTYAVKELFNDTSIDFDSTISNHELTENIAYLFVHKDVSAIHAIKKNGKYVYIKDDIGYIIFPWVNGKPLQQNPITEQHVINIAILLAKIHKAKLDIPELISPQFEEYEDAYIDELLSSVNQKQLIFSSDLSGIEPLIKEIFTNYRQALPFLRSNLVVTHGEIDTLNVLWNEDLIPTLVDWENACKLNPTYDFMYVTLEWCSVSSDFNNAYFKKMLAVYKQEGGIIDPSSFRIALFGVLGKHLTNMFDSLKLILKANNKVEQYLAVQEVQNAIKIVNNLKRLINQIIGK
jgi:thiamine kinase-like enzyme